MSFRKDFIWGAAASAFQIEGGFDADGKGPSIWDYYPKAVPNAIVNNDNGDVACDFYHKYEQDIELMSKLGLKHFRLSISWSRVLPDGIGKPNKAGLYFYSKLIDALLSRGITPWVTLFHWDMPLALHRKGGWMNPDSIKWFADYTRLMVDTLSDRVTHWITINEPQVYIGAAYNSGRFAPFIKMPLCDQLEMAHNTLLAHGVAVDVIREYAKQPPVIGAAPTSWPMYPVDENDPANIEAARRATFDATTDNVCGEVVWYTDAIFKGHYPEDGVEKFHKIMPKINPGDMEQISRPLDFFGMNAYGGHPIDALGNHLDNKVGCPANAIGWKLNEDSLYWNARFMYERYGVPMVFTENGYAGTDHPLLDGTIPDMPRIDYIKRALRQLNRAAEDGVPILGYFYWSLMDNMEWGSGYLPRFGLVHVDFETLERTPKQSFGFYKEVIESNGEVALQ